jgi:hypothetical protein
MATIYQRNDNTSQLMSQLGMQLSNLFYEDKLRNDYYKSLSDSLGEYDNKVSEGKTEDFTMQLPKEWQYQKPDPRFAQIQQMSPSNAVLMQGLTGRPQGEFMPSGTEPRQTTIPMGELSFDEREALKEKYRSRAEVIGSKVPRSDRVDPYTLYPKGSADADGNGGGSGSSLPGAIVWRGFDKKAFEKDGTIIPLPGVVTRGRNKPNDTSKVMWDVEKGTEGFYGAVSTRESREVETSKDLQQLFNNYKNDKTADNFRELNRAYNVQGKELIKQDSTTYEKIAKTFGFGKDKPEFLLRDIKSGSYTAVNSQGEEFDFKKDKYTPGKVYKDAEGKKAKYLGNGKWQTM